MTIQEFRGKTLVSIREYYKKDGKQLPTSKGTFLTSLLIVWKKPIKLLLNLCLFGLSILLLCVVSFHLSMSYMI